MLLNSEILNSTDVRKEWGEFIDVVVRKKPQFVKRTRDHIMAVNLEMMVDLLKAYELTANVFTEEDGTVTMSLNEIDIVVNGKDKEEAKYFLIEDLIEYAVQYMNEFELWFSAPNRKPHFPYILKILLSNTKEDIGGYIKCHHGKI